MLIGVISDTHAVIRPAALRALKDCEAILHAGDVGSPAVMEALQAIAPVHAVKGNVDTQPWARVLPVRLTVEFDGIRIHVVHRMADLRAVDAHCVVTGHSHVPSQSTKEGVLYLNPGSAGPRRFDRPVTLMRLRIGEGLLHPELVTLVR